MLGMGLSCEQPHLHWRNGRILIQTHPAWAYP